MSKPYGLCADLHCNNWTAFATIDAKGRNSRLMETLAELDRCADEVLKAGGEDLIIAGDLFHVRGVVTPSVFNLVRDCLARIRQRGVLISGIPGNHDLAGKDSDALCSAVQMLNQSGAVNFVHKVRFEDGLVLVPWQRDLPTLRAELDQIDFRDELDLIIHRGIDGTLSHMPTTGFTAEFLADYGFRRVWAGDYHHMKEFGRGVFSIGALTHQTWSDVGTKAGFWIVHDDRQQWFASRAPQFLDLVDLADPDSVDLDELALDVDGNYVRAKIGEADASAVAEWRRQLLAIGAKGVLIQALPASVGEKREGVSAKSLLTLDKSVMDYVTEKKHNVRVGEICAEILTEIAA